MDTAEHQRLGQARAGTPWRMWGPYLAERQWGTVREDTSADGDAWADFTHDQSRWRAYRWGEDGIAGISDDHQRLCLAVAMWNGADPILKERLFGLNNAEGNHGEDVKEYYYFLDNTPTHAYQRYLYKYPQAPFPYADLVAGNAARSRLEPEYELIDTGVFDEDRYFDIDVEYAKAGPTDVLVRITCHNRGPDDAELHLLPTLWFRDTWWMGGERPSLRRHGSGVVAEHADLGAYHLAFDGGAEWLFTDNVTNDGTVQYTKDAFHRYVVNGDEHAVNPGHTGTKVAGRARHRIPAGGTATTRLRLSATPLEEPFGPDFDATFAVRIAEADEFYGTVIPAGLEPDAAAVMRQALAGMLWSKQYYHYDLERWLAERGASPLTGRRVAWARNQQWYHMVNADIISMPDTWEYPWYAAWDLAFHAVALGMVDIDFAKNQLDLMIGQGYLHPNGQIPAYEWNFSDVNPPVHAWATYFLYSSEKALTGVGDTAFLARAMAKLSLNFTWWVNRKDRDGRNVFEGGFLGLDNIGVFDRSSPLPTGGHLEQADGTAWMAFYSQVMLQMALELAVEDAAYEEMALKYFEHFLWIGSAMDRAGDLADEMWDERDGFFYDLLVFPDGHTERIRIRSLVGLLPLCASTVFESDTLERLPQLARRLRWILEDRRALVERLAPPDRPGHQGRLLLAITDESKLRRILERMLDENEFLGPHGIRSLSKFHLDHPYVVHLNGTEYRVGYLPAESDSGMFGGNSNWRGPVWFPVNALIIRALLSLYHYYGDDFTVECPTGSGTTMTLFEVAREISDRLGRTFLRDQQGRRPVFGGSEKFQSDPHWRDHLLFYEYFNGDDGAGMGASHQTGWTGLVAKLIDMFAPGEDAAALGGTSRQ
jgi:hypothetical protein